MISKRFYYGVIFLSLMGLVLSFLFLPRRAELALIYLTDHHFKQAFELYEQQRQDGIITTDTVMALAQLYIQHGNMDKAIELLEGYLENNPQDEYAARRKLAQLYKDAQRPADYVRNLKQLVEIQPDEDVLRELASMQNFTHQTSDQIQTLENLIKNGMAGKDDHLNLAYLYAGQQQFDKAAQQIDTAISEDEELPLTMPVLDFAVSVYLEAGRTEDAQRLAAEVFITPQTRQPANALLLADRLRSKLSPDQTLEFLELAQETLGSSPLITARQAALYMEQGKAKRGYKILQDLYQQKQLPVAYRNLFLRQALIQEDVDTLLDIATNGGTGLEESSLLDILLYANQHNIKALVTEVGRIVDPNRTPVAYTGVVAVKNSTPILPLLNNLQKRRFIPAAHTIQLIRLLQQSNHPKEALHMLNSIKNLTMIEEDSLPDLATLYLEMNPKAGERIFYRRIKKAELQDSLWAALAIATGKTEEAQAWLDTASDYSLPALEVLLAAAQRSDQPKLLLQLTEKLYEKQPGNTEIQLLLAEAYLNNDRSADAMPILKPLIKHDPRSHRLYATALAINGETTALDQFLQTHYLNSAASKDDVRQMAFDLLDQKQKKPALALFKHLAQNAPPTSPDVEQLFFLWGPRPPQSGLTWIQERLNASNGKDKLAWLQRLVQIGQSDTVIKIIEGQPALLSSTAFYDVYLEALLSTNNLQKAASTLGAHIAKENSIKRLERLGQAAVGIGSPALTEQAYGKILTLDSRHPVATKQQGHAAYERGHFQKAKEFYDTYLGLGPPDYLVHYRLGEIALRALDQPNAEKQFKTALSLVNKMSYSASADIQAATVRALCQHRLGETEQAVKTFEGLIKAYPHNPDIRADFADVLIDVGRFEQAEKILEPVKDLPAGRGSVL